MKYIDDDRIYKWAKNNNENLADKLKDSYQNIVDIGLNKDNYSTFLVARKNIIIKMYLDK
jgi:hypothetical protein